MEQQHKFSSQICRVWIRLYKDIIHKLSIFSPCLCGIHPDIPVSSHTPKHMDILMAFYAISPSVLDREIRLWAPLATRIDVRDDHVDLSFGGKGKVVEVCLLTWEKWRQVLDWQLKGVEEDQRNSAPIAHGMFVVLQHSGLWSRAAQPMVFEVVEQTLFFFSR